MLLRLLTLSLQKINEDNLDERDDYGVPFSDKQYRHRSYYTSLFKYKSFDQSDPPESPQILDIYSVVVLQLALINVDTKFFSPHFCIPFLHTFYTPCLTAVQNLSPYRI